MCPPVSVLVVVVAVHRVPVGAVNVVDVVVVHDGLMPATVAVGVVMVLGDHVGVGCVFVVVVSVRVVRMTVVEVVDVAVVLHRDVAAGRPVLVVVIGVGRVRGHGINVLSSSLDQYYANILL